MAEFWIILCCTSEGADIRVDSLRKSICWQRVVRQPRRWTDVVNWSSNYRWQDPAERQKLSFLTYFYKLKNLINTDTGGWNCSGTNGFTGGWIHSRMEMKKLPLFTLKLSIIPLSILHWEGGRVRVWMGEGWFLQSVLFFAKYWCHSLFVHC